MARSDFSDLEKYIQDEEALTAFRKLMAYKDSLAHDDEIAKIIETMGLFAVVANTIPARLAEQTETLSAALNGAASIPADTKEALEDFSLNNDRLEQAALFMQKKADEMILKHDARLVLVILLLMTAAFLAGMFVANRFF